MTENKTTINTEALKRNIKTLEGWQLKKNTVIECNYTFNNFKDITAFLNHLVDTITELNHHPDFSLDTNSRTIFVSLTTHSKGCITQADIDFAHKLNNWTTIT